MRKMGIVYSITSTKNRLKIVVGPGAEQGWRSGKQGRSARNTDGTQMNKKRGGEAIRQQKGFENNG